MMARCFRCLRLATFTSSVLLLAAAALVNFTVGTSAAADGTPFADVYAYAPVTNDMRAKATRIINAALNPANSSDVYNRLAQLTDDFGPRFSGSPALTAALQWVVATARTESHWYNTTAEPVMVPSWIRGNEWATLQTPTRNKTLHFVGLGMSNGTQGRVITAPVIVVRNYTELQNKKAEAAGKIVVYNVPFTSYGDTVQYRSHAAVWAREVGAVAGIIRSVATYSMQTPHTGGSTPDLVPAGAVSVEDATQLQRLYDRGIPMTISVYMEAHMRADQPSHNIIFELRGSEKPDEYVVFGGHSDSWDIAEGAMDDGGGITAAWGAIRILASLGIRSKRTLRAVMWVNEENGDRGGMAYAAAHANELNYTSLAFETDEGAFSPWTLSFTGSDAAYNQLVILSELLKPLGSGNVTRGGMGTDISPMHDRGVPAASIEPRDPRSTDYSNNPCRDMLSPADFANSQLGSVNDIPPGYFWFHHSAADTIDRMDPVQLQTVAATLAVWAVAVGDLPELLPRDGGAPPNGPPGDGRRTAAGTPDEAKGTDQIVAVVVPIVAVVAVVMGAAVFFTFRRSRSRRAALLDDIDNVA